jgi:hypothetical protein
MSVNSSTPLHNKSGDYALVFSRTLDGDMGHVHLRQPICHRSQLDGQRPNVLYLDNPIGLLAGRIGGHSTGRHPPRVDIQPCTVWKDNVHTPLQNVWLMGYPSGESLRCVLGFQSEAGDSPWCLQVSGSNCYTGAQQQAKNDLRASHSSHILQA